MLISLGVSFYVIYGILGMAWVLSTNCINAKPVSISILRNSSSK